MLERFPLQFLLVTLADWVNRHQLAMIEYLREENRALEQHIGRRRLRLTNDQRRRLASKGPPTRATRLDHIATLVTLA
jgi:hypothetical protein